MKNWISCFMLILCIACTGNGVPGGVLPKDKMEAVIWDMIQADQYCHEYVIKDSLKKNIGEERLKLYERVFRMHQTTREEFDKSYAYYSTHPKLMQDVFDSLSTKGTRKLQDFYKPAIQPDTSGHEIIRKRLDSLRRQ